jgi:hypothetical protein
MYEEKILGKFNMKQRELRLKKNLVDNDFEFFQINSTEFSPDPKGIEIEKSFENVLQKKLGRVLAYAPEILDARSITVRKEESGLGFSINKKLCENENSQEITWQM